MVELDIACFGSQGPRVLPGTYTLRLTKGAQKIETKLEIGLDRCAPWTVADRKENFDAAMRVHALFGDMSTLIDRLEGSKTAAAARLKALPQGDALAPKLQALSERLEDLLKKIVATKEGGAITGEERIREHTDQLYGALLGWEGGPASTKWSASTCYAASWTTCAPTTTRRSPTTSARWSRSCGSATWSRFRASRGKSAELEGEAPRMAFQCLQTRGVDCEQSGRAATR